ncbi:hypothetical protein RCH11_002020 [Glaciihabitans sp. GrIS 2.15]|nr:hypothetical protein [Glaciihabitans sp. GrIS 2.15]
MVSDSGTSSTTDLGPHDPTVDCADAVSQGNVIRAICVGKRTLSSCYAHALKQTQFVVASNFACSS